MTRMQSLTEMVAWLSQRGDCHIENASNNVDFKSNERKTYPSDLISFYSLCNGGTLFSNSPYSFCIVPFEEINLVNPIIIGEIAEYDITSQWYVICRDKDKQILSIDLSSERNGKCYDSFIDRHGIVGECPVIALSFTELISRLIYNLGDYPYWLKDSFVNLGDAYDGIDI